METIVNLYGLSLKVLIYSSVAFLIYSFYTLHKNKNVELLVMPKFYNFIYLKLSEFAFIRVFMEYLQKGFYLIYVDKMKSKMLSTTLICLYPSIFIIMFVFLNSFSYVWYFTVLNFILSLVFPFYFIKNYTLKRCINIRRSMISSYTSIAALLDQNRIPVAVEEVIKSSLGPRRIILQKFLDMYSADKILAYEFLVDILGDRYTDSIVKHLRKFEEYGINPMDEIMLICNDAESMYQLDIISKKNFTSIKIVSVGCLFFNIFVFFFGKALMANMGGTFGSFTMYFSAFVCSLVFISCFIMESM